MRPYHLDKQTLNYNNRANTWDDTTQSRDATVEPKETDQ